LIKKLALLAIGLGAGPVVQLLATPWLSRIYTPHEFGSFALFLSLIGILGSIACLRYDSAMQVVNERLIKPIILIALLSSLVMFLFICLLLLFGLPQLLYQPLEEIGTKLYGIPVASFCSGIMLLLYSLTLRQDNFSLNSLSRAIQPIAFVITAILFSNNGLIQAQVISWVLAASLGLFYIAKDITFVKPKLLWVTAIRFKQYPILLTFTSLLDATALSLPVFIISFAYGSEATGNFSQLQRLIGAPLLLAGAVAGQIFFKYSGELFRLNKTSYKLMWKTFNTLLSIGFLLLLLLFFEGEQICRRVLGDGWRVDLIFLFLVTIPILARSIVSPISTIFLTHHRIDMAVRWQVGYFIVSALVLIITALNYNFEEFLLVYAINDIVCYLIYLAMINKVASLPFRSSKE
jgi:O-antigen/teichoic acid export membrane protein